MILCKRVILIWKQLVSRVHSLFEVRWDNNKSQRARSTMSDTVVTVEHGKLQGAVQNNVLGSTYIAFKGIPYAAPPIGNLRFKDPQPLDPWTGIKDVSENVDHTCAQVMEYPPFIYVGTEDCLYLNVYTNSLTGSKPVIFWIHGGAFTSGNANFSEIRPDYLLARDVVMVAPNYRLGAFGFLNLGHRVASGNYGMKDLIAALEWVKTNIANFGGDPNNVTIYGASAGGVLVHALTISPRAKGNFHKAIASSGVLLCHWGITQSKPENGFKLASILGKTSKNPEEVVDFLRNIPTKEIAEAHVSIIPLEEKRVFTVPFGLNFDSFADNPVLPGSFETLYSNDVDIPFMTGYAKYEALMFIRDKTKKTMDGFNYYLPRYVKQLATIQNLAPREQQRLLQAVKDRYFDGDGVTPENFLRFGDFISDVHFGIPARVYVDSRLERKCAPSYFYVHSYYGYEKTLTDLLVQRVIRGASHVDELSYLFYLPNCKKNNPNPPAVGTKDRTHIERMTRLWANFAKTGNPTPNQDEFIKTTWKPVTDFEWNYLDIGDELKLRLADAHVLDTYR